MVNGESFARRRACPSRLREPAAAAGEGVTKECQTILPPPRSAQKGIEASKNDFSAWSARPGRRAAQAANSIPLDFAPNRSPRRWSWRPAGTESRGRESRTGKICRAGRWRTGPAPARMPVATLGPATPAGPARHPAGNRPGDPQGVACRFFRAKASSLYRPATGGFPAPAGCVGTTAGTGRGPGRACAAHWYRDCSPSLACCPARPCRTAPPVFSGRRCPGQPAADRPRTVSLSPIRVSRTGRRHRSGTTPRAWRRDGRKRK